MKKIYKILFVVFFFAVFVSIQNLSVHADENTLQKPAQEETLEAIVEKVLEEKEIKPKGVESKQLYQKLELTVTKGSLKGKTIVVENGNIPVSNIQKYKAGDTVVINYSKDSQGKNIFYITDYVRRNVLLWLFATFIIIAAFIGKKQGIMSLIGMIISFFVIFIFILPNILSGHDPVIIAILGSLFIIPATFLLSHGINRKTYIAIIGTLIALVVTGILAHIFVELAQLTGFSSEEAGFLQIYKPGIINIKGLLLAGIIIGVLGVLDDITISQTAIVEQLSETNPKITKEDLYTRSMSIGKDHIASMINTLILVYTGASLPLLLIFIDNSHPISEIMNYEIIAEEMVRTLIGSIGLMLAVPITTFIAVLSVKKNKS